MYQNLSCTAIKNSESTVFPMGNEAPNVKNGYVEVSMILHKWLVSGMHPLNDSFFFLLCNLC